MEYAPDTDGSETDWLASCSQCYGYGYTQEQAILAMLAHLDPRGPDDGPLQVDLIEHVGSAQHGLGGWEVDTFVSGVTIEIPADEVSNLPQRASDITHDVQIASDSAEQVYDYSQEFEDE